MRAETPCINSFAGPVRPAPAPGALGPADDRGRRRNWPGSSRRAGRRCLRDRRAGCPGASVGHIVSEQGRPPDFMMEVASPCAARVDAGAKRDGHAALDVRSTGAATRVETIPAQGSPATSCTATPTVRCQSKGSARTSRGGTVQPRASSSDGTGDSSSGWTRPPR